MFTETMGLIVIIILILVMLVWPKWRRNSCPVLKTDQFDDAEDVDEKKDSVNDDGYNSYSDYVEDTALPAEVAESHARFVAESPMKVQIASSDTVRDDPNDIVPWVGLRRPFYHSNMASTQPSSRVVSSEDPSQMRYNTPFMIQ